MSTDEPAAVESWTVGRLLKWTTDFLQEKGVDSPRLDAEILLAHARDCQRIDLYTAFEEEATEELRSTFRELVKRRAAGTPVAYLVGHREFFSLSFHVTPDVLIPRPETELLVVRALDLAKEGHISDDLTIADVGTGSGIIAVCCAKHLAAAHILAFDLSASALQVARRNATEHSVEGQIDFIESDLLTTCPVEKEFDLILSNPPYVASSEIGELDVDVREYEPHLALDGGEQGTDIIARLVPQATERLKAKGWLLMEVGPANAHLVEALLDEQEQLSRHETIKDLAGHPRVVQAQRI